LMRMVKTYLDEMGLGIALLGPMQVARFSRHLKLEPDAMARVKLTTGPESANALAAPAICKMSPMPANCRVAIP
jgi:hypothetical protein